MFCYKPFDILIIGGDTPGCILFSYSLNFLSAGQEIERWTNFARVQSTTSLHAICNHFFGWDIVWMVMKVYIPAWEVVMTSVQIDLRPRVLWPFSREGMKRKRTECVENDWRLRWQSWWPPNPPSTFGTWKNPPQLLEVATCNFPNPIWGSRTDLIFHLNPRDRVCEQLKNCSLFCSGATLYKKRNLQKRNRWMCWSEERL